MLIEEAVALVLKAASIAQPGDINVLKMGEPVKIIEIAKSLIQLMGKREEDVKINFTGLRPGEKMFEELYISGKELNTEHPDILVVPKGDNISDSFSASEFGRKLDAMIDAAKSSDRESVAILNALVASNYAPIAEPNKGIYSLLKIPGTQH